MTCRLDACKQGREKCPAPSVCADFTRRVQEADLRWTDGIPVGYESGGIWYAEPEPEVASVTDAIVRGLLAILAIAIILGAAGFLIYTLAALP